MARYAEGPVRNLSIDQRTVWGLCPICRAAHGEPCNPKVGIALGTNVLGQPPAEGAHLARLQAAPYKVQEIALE